ncbi:MAG: hypothetical protein GX673_05040 [Gammaproteobacteria bacterium]|nr:hypothetical protein [Gammaproteobacteria bacterium]
MKYGSIVCTLLFILSVILAVVQMWFDIIAADVFWKIQLTLGGFFIIALGVTLVFKEYLSEKELKKKGYLD